MGVARDRCGKDERVAPPRSNGEAGERVVAEPAGSWQGGLSQSHGYGSTQEMLLHRGLRCQTSPASLLWLLAPQVLYKAQGQTFSPSPLGKQLIKLCSVPERSVGDVPASQPSPRACTGAGALRCAPDREGCLASARSNVHLFLVLVG